MLHNRYFVCPQNNAAAVPWDPFTFPSADMGAFVESGYLAETFRALEITAAVRGRTFYVTWNVDVLPSYGDDVIVFLMGDEWCRMPAYGERVGALFRQYGPNPTLVTAGLSMLTPLLVLQYLRAGTIGLPRRLKYAPPHAGVRSSRARAAQHVIPLGYGNQPDMAVTPMRDRTVDVFFSGSITNTAPPLLSVRRWLPSPKRAARQRMLAAARQLDAQRRDLRIVLDSRTAYVPNGFADGDGEEKVSYSATMMQAKICLVPRGSSPDTMRLFEAMRYGCVVIADRLPPAWFYRGAPVITVDRWTSLGAIVDDLLNDEARLVDLHRAALRYWHERCSGAALASYVSAVLSANGGRASHADALHGAPLSLAG
jgi:hypothetical protein